MELDDIARLFQKLGQLDREARLTGQTTEPAWQSANEAVQSVFDELAGEDNREALRKWYQQFDAINANAEGVRLALQQATGEELPLKSSDA